MKKSEYWKGSVACFSFVLVVFSALLILAFLNIGALKRACNLKKDGREVQAHIVDFYITDAPHAAHTAFVLIYEYQENGKTWGGSLQYCHRRDEAYDEKSLTNYYKSQIGTVVEITIYEKDNYCKLTSEVESSYKNILIQEICFFSIGGIGFPITLILFIRFLHVNRKNKNEKSAFIQGKKE